MSKIGTRVGEPQLEVAGQLRDFFVFDVFITFIKNVFHSFDQVNMEFVTLFVLTASYQLLQWCSSISRAQSVHVGLFSYKTQ